MDISQIISAIVLGIVEGITEFLPISSTGHLVIFNQWFRFPDPSFTNMFNFMIQTGAIVAVIIFFRKKIFPIYKSQDKQQRRDIRKLWLQALVGFLPAVVIGVLFKDAMDAYLMTPVVVAAALIVWGIVIILIERRSNHRLAQGIVAPNQTVASFGWTMVLLIGLIQCLAIVPGTSRSAATIVGAMLLGASRVAAAEFSFFLAIPTLVGAGLYSLYTELKSGVSLTGDQVAVLAIGMVVAFLVAFAVVAGFMKFIGRRDFQPFGWYRIVAGVIVIVYFLVQGNIFGAVAG